MIYVIGFVIFALAFISLYCCSVCELIWYKITISALVSTVLAVLVTTNLYL